MTVFTRTFKLDRAHLAQSAIVDAEGWTGSWPFRRRISFHVGGNCDSITLSDGRLFVHRHGWTIAVAEMGSAALSPEAAPRFSLWAYLCPRHARKDRQPEHPRFSGLRP